MRQFHLKNNSKTIIVFFCGWGSDEIPYLPLKTDCDMLFCSDYSTLPEKIDFDFSKYEKKYLIGFSFGVYAAGLCISRGLLPEFDKKIAINGTLMAVDEEFGVPEKKFLLSMKMDETTVKKFRARLFHEEKDLKIFEENLPKRSAKSCTDELLAVQEYVRKNPCPKADFDVIYTGKYDKVIPVKNQKNFWQNKCSCTTIDLESGHFPFYGFKNFEEIIKTPCLNYD